MLVFGPEASIAQSTGQTRCWRARQAPACTSFWITELALLAPAGGTAVETGFPRRHLEFFAGGEFGLMRNRETRARGVLLSAGASKSGNRFGVLGRHRTWLHTQGTLDLSGGIIAAQGRYLRETKMMTYGVTADVGLGWQDAGALVIRTDLVRGGGRTLSSMHAGMRFGSPRTIGAAVVVLSGVAMLFQGT